MAEALVEAIPIYLVSLLMVFRFITGHDALPAAISPRGLLAYFAGFVIVILSFCCVFVGSLNFFNQNVLQRLYSALAFCAFASCVAAAKCWYLSMLAAIPMRTSLGILFSLTTVGLLTLAHVVSWRAVLRSRASPGI
ncbi:MAG: hypothetical protein ABSD31_07685 [Candidatus Binataceae bacterium]|jgi:hypothetical protein